MTITDLFKPKRPGLPVCKPCNGKGRVRGRCSHCGGGGVVLPNTLGWHWCPKCSNGRCLSCGGEGHPVNAVPENHNGETPEDIPPDTRA